MSLVPSTVVVRSDAVMAAEIDGEAVMLSIDKGKYYGLDAVGTEIWNLVREPRSVGEICQALTDLYDVEPERCKSEVVRFLELLVADGSVAVVPKP